MSIDPDMLSIEEGIREYVQISLEKENRIDCVSEQEPEGGRIRRERGRRGDRILERGRGERLLNL